MDAAQILKDEVIISESCLVGIFWNNPNLYNLYNENELNRNIFTNKEWGYFFDLGRFMYKKGIVIFDDISVYKALKDLNIEEEKFEKWGGYQTVQEIMIEVKGKEENLQGCFEDVKKYELIRELIDLFGIKVIKNNNTYNYKEMTKEQLYAYWDDKVNNIGIAGDVKYQEKYLLEGLEEAIEQWDKDPDIGLPFYKSNKMNQICPGLVPGHVYILGAATGRGKSSLTVNKIFMSCIEKQEKLLVIANEMGIKDFQKILLTTVMGMGTKEPIRRQKLNEGNFSQEERNKIDKAIKWVKSLIQGNSKLIHFVFMENYIMSDVKKIIKHYASRGINYVVIDTSKVGSDAATSHNRWSKFGDDYRELYQLARADGGLNLGIWTTVQLSPASIYYRVLTEQALADYKGITRESSIVFLMRPILKDEFAGGEKELKVINFPPNPESEKGYDIEEFKLPEGERYYLLFTAKNRLGADLNSGQDVLVVKTNFNSNIWQEIGWATVYDDRESYYAKKGGK